MSQVFLHIRAEILYAIRFGRAAGAKSPRPVLLLGGRLRDGLGPVGPCGEPGQQGRKVEALVVRLDEMLVEGRGMGAERG